MNTYKLDEESVLVIGRPAGGFAKDRRDLYTPTRTSDSDPNPNANQIKCEMHR